LWISGEIIRVNANGFYAKCCGAVSKFAEFASEVDDVRAMVAGKKYDGAQRATGLVECDDFSACVR
jgi:hypothetical protein